MRATFLFRHETSRTDSWQGPMLFATDDEALTMASELQRKRSDCAVSTWRFNSGDGGKEDMLECLETGALLSPRDTKGVLNEL